MTTTITQTEALRAQRELMARVQADMGLEFANELGNTFCRVLVEAEDQAVRQHGRQILAAIEGTTWAPAGDQRIDITEDDSTLVQLVDGAGRVAS
jgi:hypothetical protein